MEKKGRKASLSVSQLQAIEVLRNKNLNSEATYFMPTKYLSYEASKVSCLFSEYFSSLAKEEDTFRTFFASSHLEAVNGTIKIIRHNAWNNARTGKILIFNAARELSCFFNPLNLSMSNELVPGVVFCDELSQISCYLEGSKDLVGFICCYDGSFSINILDNWMSICLRKNILFAYDDFKLENWYRDRLKSLSLSKLPDIFIVGENIVDSELPFGSFSMRKKIYKPWSTIPDCLNHSSSNSGNTLTLSMILNLFRGHGIDNNIDARINTYRKKVRAYKKFVNPVIGLIFDELSLGPDIISANSNSLFIKKGQENCKIIDCVGGSGSSLRGHNPRDVVTEVLDNHDTKTDYYQKLSDLLCGLSGLKHVVPAVSGSSAVDFAVIFAMLASYPKTRIITFSYNYSGKSLIALNITRYNSYRQPFKPLYFNVVEIDPYSENACNQLNEACSFGDVALVWFEIMQGNDLREIPDDLLQEVNRLKKEYSYYIGVDEVLTGVFRTGEFLCSQAKNIEYDVVTIGKGLTDMTMPQGAVLLSDHLYNKAKTYDPCLVGKLSVYYANQLGAHIALNALTKVLQKNVSQVVKNNGELLKDKLNRLSKKHEFISKVRGKGMLQYVLINKKSFTYKLFGMEVTEFLLSSYYLRHGNILLLNSRFTPSLFISAQEIEDIYCAMDKTLNRGELRFFCFCLHKVIKIYLKLFWSYIPNLWQKVI